MGKDKETRGQAQVRFGRNLGETQRSREGNKAGSYTGYKSYREFALYHRHGMGNPRLFKLQRLVESGTKATLFL